jgi:peptidoglycan hydrolase-like protein with peptidoglycan-binding domain
VASEHLQLAVGALTAPKWSPDWCIGVLKQLTFGPKITIYPQRYDKIRPKLEQHFAVNLPDFAAELKTWEAELNQEHDTPVAAEPTFLTIEDIQRFLVDQGFDLGSSGPKADGVDGQEGRKTRDAVMTFQRLNGLSADGKVGKGTRAKMLAVYRSSAADRPRSP